MSSNASPKTEPRESAPATRAGAKAAWLIALAAVLLAACARFSDLGAYSLWIDEAFSISDATSRLDVEGEPLLSNPVSYYFIRWGIEIFGRDEWGSRVLPCLAGIASVGLLAYWLARRAGAIEAIAGGLLLALSPWHHFLSQCARYYTLTLLVSLLTGIAFEAWLRSRKRMHGVLALLGLVVASQIHASSVLFAGGLLAAFALHFWLVRERPAVRRPYWKRAEIWLVAGALLALGALAWEDALPHLQQKGRFSLDVYVGNLAFYGGPVMWTAAAFAAWRTAQTRAPFALFSLGVAGGTLLCGAILAVRMTVNHQYVVAALPFLVASVAWLVGETFRSGSRLLAAALLAMPCAEAAALQALYRGPFGGFRADWRSAAALVLENLEHGDMIASNRATILEHYLSPKAVDLRDPRRVLLLGHFNHELLIELMHHPGRVWYLIGEDATSTWSDIDRESFEWHVRTRCRRFAAFPRRIGTKELGIEVWLQEPRGGS